MDFQKETDFVFSPDDIPTGWRVSRIAMRQSYWEKLKSIAEKTVANQIITKQNSTLTGIPINVVSDENWWWGGRGALYEIKKQNNFSTEYEVARLKAILNDPR